MHKPTKLIDVIVLIFSFLMVGKIYAQEVVTHQNLAADFYRGENDTAVILLHGTLAHNRMEIIKTLSTLISMAQVHQVETLVLHLSGIFPS